MLYQTTLSKTLTYVLPPGLKKTKSPVRMEEDLDEHDSDDVEPSAMTPLQMQEWDNVTYSTYYQEEEKNFLTG